LLYQVCTVKHDSETNKTIVTATAIIEAETIKKATEQAEAIHTRASIRVYPYRTPEDGNAQLALAQHTLHSVENWERRNDNAVLEPFHRTPEDREDFVMLACLTFATIFAENPAADMHTLKTAAFSAIRAEQAKRHRHSDDEYDPNWSVMNRQPTIATATYPALARLIRKATEQSELTEKQMQALTYVYGNGTSIENTADILNVTKRAIAQSLYSAQYKVLCKALEIDTDMQAFTDAGYTAEDIDETLTLLRKRARVKA